MRAPFGVPPPPSEEFQMRGGLLVLNRIKNAANLKRWRLALKCCQLISEDRHAAERDQALRNWRKFGGKMQG